MGGASGTGGSDRSDEKKVDTYSDQLKKEQARKSKFKTDKFGYTVKKNIGERYVDNHPVIQGVKNTADKLNLNRRMKFANKNNINLQGLNTKTILSKDFKSQLDAKGYTKKTVNTVGKNDNQDVKTPLKTGIFPGESNGDVTPTTAEIDQGTSTMMSDAEILIKNKKRGKSSTILTRATGLGNSSLNTTKKTLGA